MAVRNRDLEGVARRFLAASGNSLPSREALLLAWRHGYKPWPCRRRGASARGRWLYYDTYSRPAERQRIVSAALARLALRQEKKPVTKDRVQELAAMLIVSDS